MQILVVRGDDVWRRFGQDLGAALGEPEVAGPEGIECTSALDALRAWQSRYAKAAAANNASELLSIGEEMGAWLAKGGALDPWLHAGERWLEIHHRPNEDQALNDALVEAPWELLAIDRRPLAADALRPFMILRRTPSSEPAAETAFSDLRLMFMAAAPAGERELDYEAEEAAILEATRSRTRGEPRAHVVVEESGALEFLGERLDGRDGVYEALHISCHGDVVPPIGPDGEREGPARPVLMLERPEGGAREVTATELVTGCAKGLPPLVFVSACSTARREGDALLRGAERYRDKGLAEAPALFGNEQRKPADSEPAKSLAEPFVRDLVVRVPNVLGWDGSVYDQDASLFAELFYGALAGGQFVPVAASVARRGLLDALANDPNKGRHWHLARVYLGPGGGHPLCQPGLEIRRQPRDPTLDFLDPKRKKVPVAGRDTFVGRRRLIQRGIAILRAGPRGLLAHGMGNLGKSSLAARIAGRLSGLRTAVVVGEAHTLAILQTLQDAARDVADTLPYNEAESLRQELQAMSQTVAQDDGRLEDVVRRLLAGVFDNRPVFLVLDDFERSLEDPRPDGQMQQPKAAYRPALQALFRAFARAGVTSRLMITCRYDFTLSDGQNDLTEFLDRLPLAPMPARERQKQWRAQVRAGGRDGGTIDDQLLTRALNASGGNPGLQDVLTRPLLEGEISEAETAIATVEAFQQTGQQPPTAEDPGDFFARMAFDTYSKALTPSERTALSAACHFTVALPIPLTALSAAGRAAGLSTPEPALARLLALGLLDDHGQQSGWPSMPLQPHAAVNPLARPLADALNHSIIPELATATLPALAQAWRNNQGDFPRDARAIEVTRLALAAETIDPSLLDTAATAAVIFLFKISHAAVPALLLAEPALARLEALGHPPSARLLGHTINAAERVGRVELQERLLNTALERSDIEPGLLAQLQCLKGDRFVRAGMLNEAMQLYMNDALPKFVELKDRQQIAIAKGKIADILVTRGDLDGALAMHLERLPIAQAMEDIDSIAHIRGNCAGIRLARVDHERGEIQTIFDELAEAFVISQKLQRPDFIGWIGDLLGQVLALAGQREEAVGVFRLAAAGWRKLGREEVAQRIDAIIRALEE